MGDLDSEDSSFTLSHSKNSSHSVWPTNNLLYNYHWSFCQTVVRPQGLTHPCLIKWCTHWLFFCPNLFFLGRSLLSSYLLGNSSLRLFLQNASHRAHLCKCQGPVFLVLTSSVPSEQRYTLDSCVQPSYWSQCHVEFLISFARVL